MLAYILYILYCSTVFYMHAYMQPSIFHRDFSCTIVTDVCFGALKELEMLQNYSHLSNT